MVFVYKGAIVKEPIDIQGIIISVDRANKSVVVHKNSGGFTSCPLNMIKMISHEPAGATTSSSFNHALRCY